MSDETKPTPDPTILTTEQLIREVERVNTLFVARQIGADQLNNERFNSVNTQFALVERQRVELKSDTKVATDAALSAAEKAVREQTTASEKAIDTWRATVTEQLRGMEQNWKTSDDATKRELQQITTRIERIENLKQGNKEAYGGIYAAIAGVATVLGLIIWAAGTGAFS